MFPMLISDLDSHVDHMRFSCMPAALEMDILMAFRVHTRPCPPSSSSSSTRSVQFHLENTSNNFQGTSFRCSIDSHDDCVQLEHAGPTRWANYFKVAYKVHSVAVSFPLHLLTTVSSRQGLLPHLPKMAFDSSPCDVKVLIDGSIPPESSLSSSAAMTTCSSIVILQSFKAREEISRKEMAEVAIESGACIVSCGAMPSLY